MCGIVGYTGPNPCCDILIDCLSRLEYRGYDSAGIAVCENGGIVSVKAAGKLKHLKAKIADMEKPKGTCGIGHTRWATHGVPNDINAHPHGTDRVMLVHNGIIENYKEIKSFLTEKGYSFYSQTDSETVAKLIDYYYDEDPLQAIVNAKKHLVGSYSLGILFADRPGIIYALRQDSPLIVGKGTKENFIASDVPAILHHTRSYYILEHDEIAVIAANQVTFLDLEGNVIAKELHEATWDIDAAEKAGYDHFMIKEIHEQPSVIAKTMRPHIINGMPDFSDCGVQADDLRTIRKLHIIGCGSAVHAGLIGEYLIEKLTGLDVEVSIASEFRYRDPIIHPGDFVIAISQSGETADTLEALRLSKKKGAKTLGIINVVGSSIARESDMVCYTQAGPEISVCSTKAYMVQMTTMYLFAFELAYIRGSISAEACRYYVRQMNKIPAQIEQYLSDTSVCQHAATHLKDANSLLYIGRGLDYCLSMEGSLKLKEISYIHSESYAAGELKHGTISLIENGTPVIAIATQSSLIHKTMSNIQEVKSRGAFVIVVTTDRHTIKKDAADFVITIPDNEEILLPLLAAVPMQLLAYYTAIIKGNNVDQPRNLAKSVTVE